MQERHSVLKQHLSPLCVARNPNNQRRPWCYVQVGLKQLVQECMVQDCSFGECQGPIYDDGVEGDKLICPLNSSQEKFGGKPVWAPKTRRSEDENRDT